MFTLDRNLNTGFYVIVASVTDYCLWCFWEENNNVPASTRGFTRLLLSDYRK